MDRRLISAILVVLIASVVGGEESGVKDERVVVEEVRKWGVEREVEEKLVWWIEWMGEVEKRLGIEEYSTWRWKQKGEIWYLLHETRVDYKVVMVLNIFPSMSQWLKWITLYYSQEISHEGEYWSDYGVWFFIPPEGVVLEQLPVSIDGKILEWVGSNETIGEGIGGSYWLTDLRNITPPKVLEVGDLQIPLYWEEFWGKE